MSLALAPVVLRRALRIRLWIPLIAVWIILAPFALVLGPIAMIVAGAYGLNPFAGAWTIGGVLVGLHGVRVEIESPHASIRIHLL
jgi:hypothetical protein